jgi:hypothetical protein
MNGIESSEVLGALLIATIFFSLLFLFNRFRKRKKPD